MHSWVTPIILDIKEEEIKRSRELWLEASPVKYFGRLSWKYPMQKSAGGVVQVVEHL
jgi:hypothetical protein